MNVNFLEQFVYFGVVGDLLIIAAQVITAVQMVYEEKFVVKHNVPALQAVGWEGKMKSASKFDNLCHTVRMIGDGFIDFSSYEPRMLMGVFW